MRFTLLDRIIDLQPGVSVRAIKCLTSAEEYLQDHFPRFPVMPGVLMLEAMFQASAWLIRRTDDFAHSIVMLREAKNIKYADFVEPGNVLMVQAEIAKDENRVTTLKAQGTMGGASAVSGRLVIERFNLAEKAPHQASLDPIARRLQREQFRILFPSFGARGSTPSPSDPASGSATGSATM